MNISFKSLALALVILAVLGATLLAGCVELTPTTLTTSSTSGAGTVTVTATASPTWTPTVESGGEALPDIADVVALVKPSVVAINTRVPMTDLFGGQTLEQASGSGWILDANGIIVTNNHVVEGAQSISVTLDDGRTFDVDPATVSVDPINDLAILRIDASGLPALKTGDSSQLRVGDWVVAIGNSLGMGIRATVGIVSQLGVTLELSSDQALYNLINTSAVINPGNSGGPLVNLAGEVIGITSAKIVASGAEATGFAISSEEATPIITQLVNQGYVVRPFLGVQGLITVDSMVASYYRLDTDAGVLVRGIVDGSPAADAGLEAGDVIFRIGGTEVATLNELTQVLYGAAIGEPLDIGYWRNGKQVTTTIVPVASPAPTASGG
jgi:serine protease Do